jgi:hypothetical protein
MITFLLSFGPAILALIGALITWLCAPGFGIPLQGRTRLITLTTTVLVVAVHITFSAWLVFPFPLLLVSDLTLFEITASRTMLPLVLTLIALLGLLASGTALRGGGAAELTRRTLRSFVRPWWLSVCAAVLGVIVLATVVAGLASRPDEVGRFVLYQVKVGEGSTATWIYGWHFSVPCLIAVALITALSLFELSRIAAPSLRADAERDRAERRVRSRNVLAVAAGGLLLHLGQVAGSLFGTASLQGQFATDSLGPIAVTTPFAAMAPSFLVASYVFAIVGLFLWFSVAFSSFPIRATRARSASVR